MDWELYAKELENIIGAITLPDDRRITVDAFVEQARKKAEGGQDAGTNPHWIPVEERLPNDGQVVFIYTKHGSVSSVTYKDGAFNLNEVLEAINVTHWMPIVPPRKEE